MKLMREVIKPLVVGMIAVAAVQLCPQIANAQFGGDRINRPLNRPTVSPYLNLFRRGNSGSNSILNYYGLVRPQNQAIQRDHQLNSNLREFERDVKSSSNDSRGSMRRPMLLGTTGHRTSFMTIGGGGGGGQRGGSSGDEGQAGGSSGHSATFGNGPGFGSSTSGSVFGSD